MKRPASEPSPDPDIINAEKALIRAAKRARKLAEETGTELVYVRDGKLIREVPQPPKSIKRRSAASDSN